MPRTSARVHLLILGAYALLALMLTYPVVTAPTRLIPGSDTWAYDEYTFIWNIWWFKHAVLDLGVNPLHTNYTFYPIGTALVLYTYNLLYAAFGLALFPLTGLPLAGNLLNWLGLALGGYTAYLLCRYLLLVQWRRQEGVAAQVAPFLGGIAYAFAGSRFVYLALGHYMLAAILTLPLFALFLLRSLEPDGRRRYALMAALALVLSLLIEMTFGLFLALLALVIGLSHLRRLGPVRLAARLGLVAGGAVLGYAPVLYYVLRESFVGGYSLEGWGDSVRLSVDLAGLLTPTALHPVWGSDWPAHLRRVAEGTGRFSDVHTFFLGYAALALTLAGAVALGRRALPWLITAAGAVVLSLGPLLQVNGRSVFDLDGLQTTVPLPFVLLHYVPLANAGRTPNRFSVLFVLAVTPLVALGCYWLLTRLRRWYLLSAAAAVLALALVWDGLALPLPTTDASVPPFYAELGRDGEDYAILNLPFGVRSSFGTRGAERTQLQYYQTAHGKRLVGGNISRAPALNFAYYEEVEPLAALFAVETYRPLPDTDMAELRRQAAELAALLDIRYLVAHAPVPGRYPYADTYGDTLAFALSLFDVTEVHRDPQGRLIAYRIDAAPPAEVAVDLGQAPDSMYLGEGWSHRETIQGASARWLDGVVARLYLPVRQPAEHVLTFSALPFRYPGAPAQTLTVAVNGRIVGTLPLQESWAEYSVTVPAAALHRGANTVELRPSHRRSPAVAFPESADIGGTGRRAPTRLEVNSGPDLAYITVGEADGSKHAPGLNVAVFGNDGSVTAREFFGWEEGQRLGRFVADLRSGAGAIVAVRGGAPSGIDEAVCEALRQLGAAGCPPEAAPAYALIGVKGAAPGTALEASGQTAYLSLAPDERQLSVAVNRLTWQRPR